MSEASSGNKPPCYSLSEVAIFRAGTHRGKTYTPRDLDSMVSNFRRNSAGGKPTLRVPAVLGHEEKQDLLNRSDLPAAAWANKLYRKGPVLYADFEGVPEPVAKLIEGRAYRTVSAEVYDEPPDGLTGKGKTLRRVAFLGGDIPQIKGLGDIPLPVRSHSESSNVGFAAKRPIVLRLARTKKGSERGLWTCFSEVVGPMDRQQMIEELARHGCDVSHITDAVPDDVIAEMLRVCDDKDAGQAEGYMEQVESGKAHDWPEPDGDEQKAKYRERAKKYYEHAKKHYEKYGDTPAVGGSAPGGDDVDALTVKRRDEEPARMSEIESIIRRVIDEKASGAIGRIERFSEEREAAEKKRSVDALVDQLSREGRLAPSEKEGERQLLSMLDARTLHKFSEGGRPVERSAFDHRVKQLKARPCKFGEVFKSAGKTTGSAANSSGGGGGEHEDADEAKIAQHFDENSHLFERVSASKEDLIGGFKAAKKYDKTLTAESYLNGK